MKIRLPSAEGRRALGALFVALIAWSLPLAVSAAPETGFVISEIMFDPVGGDDSKQWIELYNGTSGDITLDDYSLGWGRNDYTRGVFQLSGGLLAPGEAWIVGGPTSNDDNGNPDFSPNGQALDLDPNPQRGDNKKRPDGVALFELAAADIVRGSDPIHAVIYGLTSSTTRPWLTDESGVTGSGVILITTDGISQGESIEMVLDGSWQVPAAPSPGVTAIPEPGTCLLVLAGLAVLAGSWRRIAVSG